MEFPDTAMENEVTMIYNQEGDLHEHKSSTLLVDGDVEKAKTVSQFDGDVRKNAGDVRKNGGLNLRYAVDDIPPLKVSVIMGLQVFLSLFMIQVIGISMIDGPLCLSKDIVGKTKVLCTLTFTAGIATIMQATLGITLRNITTTAMDTFNGSFVTGNNISVESDPTPAWHYRFREIQGALIIASLFQMIIGYAGIIGALVRHVTPLVICVVISLIVIPFYALGSELSGLSWPVSALVIFLSIIFSQYLQNVKVPVPAYSKTKRCYKGGFPIFGIFPILTALTIVWFLCGILTWSNALSREPGTWQYLSRTDTMGSVISNSPWFRIPYPMQWGSATFSAAAAIGMMGSVIASVIESVGTFYICANVAGAPSPPVHAINRGIGVEGTAGLLSGILGAGVGLTTYSDNMGVIVITRVGSRRVTQFAGLWLISFSLFPKAISIFQTIPEPALGAVFFFLIGLIVSSALSYIRFIDITAPRNVFLLGFSLVMGLGIPHWVSLNMEKIKTGYLVLDHCLQMVLRTPMLLGSIVSLTFESILPGKSTKDIWFDAANDATEKTTPEKRSPYDLPFGMGAIRRWKFTNYMPTCPTFSKLSK